MLPAIYLIPALALAATETQAVVTGSTVEHEAPARGVESDRPASSPPAGSCALRFPLGGIGSASEDLARVAELTGAAPVRPQLFRRWSSRTEAVLCEGASAPHPGALPVSESPKDLVVEPLPVEWRTYLDSGYPDDRNDGALWQGRGISTALTAGARFRWRFLSAGFAPLFAWQQNRDFYHPAMAQAGFSPYANPFNYGMIDLPVRFGPTDFWTLDPGQSYVRADAFNVALGFSTENLWWGPGIRNSLLMTNSAAGFPHLFLGTSRPQNIAIGWIEAQMIWGVPRESKWFDTDPTNDERFFNSLNIGFEPRFIPGLFFGLTRLYQYKVPPSGLPLRFYLGQPLINPFLKEQLPRDQMDAWPENQLFSLSARWVFPRSGLEIYGEWGRDDHNWDLRDFVTHPEHAHAFMLGFQKVFPAGQHWIRFVAELTHTLDKPTNNPPRGVAIFYTHGREAQGHTNDGQMVGAGIGPQADSQFLALDLFHPRGRGGIWAERVLRNGRWFYDQIHYIGGQDAEIAGGMHGAWSWREVDVDASLGYGHRYNMNFGPDAQSWKGMLSVTWWPGRTSVPRLVPARVAAQSER